MKKYENTAKTFERYFNQIHFNFAERVHLSIEQVSVLQKHRYIIDFNYEALTIYFALLMRFWIPDL